MEPWIIAVLAIIALLVGAKIVLATSVVSVLPLTRGAMFHPSAHIRVRTFLDAMPMSPGELLIDIGCGDARVLRGAHKRYGVRAVGFEVNPLAYALARLKTLFLRGVDIRMSNFWKVDIGEGDIIFCYLFPDVMKDLRTKLESELRKGARVVSCNFPIPGWTALDIRYPDSSLNNDPIYFYRFPDSVPGSLNLGS